MVSVIAGDNSTRSQLPLQKFEDTEVKTLGSIEEDHIDFSGRIGQGLQSIAHPKFNPLLQTGSGKVALCLLCFFRLELGRDEFSRSVITDGRS